MAVTTGNDYDHIDIVNGSTQTRHMLKDASARADVADLKSALNDDVFGGLITRVTKGSIQNGVWASTNSGYCIFLKVTPGASFKITSAPSYQTVYYGIQALETMPPADNTTLTFSSADGWTGAKTIASSNTGTGTIPDDVNYLYFYTGTNASPTRSYPVVLEIDGVDYSKAILALVRDHSIALTSVRTDASDAKTIAGDADSATRGILDANVMTIDDLRTIPSSVAFEQGSFNMTKDTESDKDIRTVWADGGFYIYNPSQEMLFCVMKNVSGTKAYMAFGDAVDGVDYYYKDKLAFLPKRMGWTYRIKIQRRVDGAKVAILPTQNLLSLLEPVDGEFAFTRGAVASGGYSDSAASAVTQEITVGSHIGIRFRLVDSDYRFALYATKNGTSFSTENGGWQNQGESLAFDTDKNYVCRVGAKSGATFNLDSAIRAIQIEYIDDVYGYKRHYNDITYSLDWQRKTIDATNGMIDSTTDIMAEIPSRGCVELKMNHTYTNFRFAVWKQVGNGTWTQLQDWTHYFYRYLPDEGAVCHYYVVCKCDASGYTENPPFTLGLRGLRVYIYEDVGTTYKLPSPFYGKTVAVMGDSIVQGRFAKNNGSVNTVHTHPWPVLIAEKSNTQPADFGIGGATVYGDTWDTLYTNRNAISGYDVVLVCAGTNDYGANVTEENFKAAYTAVLQALTANNTTVYAVTPTRRVQDISTKNSINLTLSDYSRFISEVAATLEIPVIDLFSMTRSHKPFIASMTDGLHPNEAGQRIIADLILGNVD